MDYTLDNSYTLLPKMQVFSDILASWYLRGQQSYYMPSSEHKGKDENSVYTAAVAVFQMLDREPH